MRAEGPDAADLLSLTVSGQASGDANSQWPPVMRKHGTARPETAYGLWDAVCEVLARQQIVKDEKAKLLPPIRNSFAVHPARQQSK
jgi:hypothetical protein